MATNERDREELALIRRLDASPHIEAALAGLPVIAFAIAKAVRPV